MNTQPIPVRKSGFTLLELLVVVAILAIIGGGMLVAFDGLDSQAAKGVATNSIASVNQTARTFSVIERRMPDNLETLLAGTPGTPAYSATEFDTTAADVTGVVKAGLLGSKLAGKFGVRTLTPDQVQNLIDAGVTRLRYLDLKGNDETTADLDIFTADGAGPAAGVGPLSQITIPQHAFEPPRPGTGRNRGRGFALDLVAADPASVELAVWSDQDPSAPDDLYNNQKVGARPDAVLVMLGVGNKSDIVSADDDGLGAVGNARFASAPFYGDVAKNEYNHYILLVDVNQNPARIITVVDPRGDFLDEEFAETTGQKQ